ncbi:conserved protein of unknown function [Nitrospira japonica]|uniref:Uncharacterized protein n=1 Tax=Nitrospira japonica TaxID=1325564 RepID=A0A1W1I524_9BACT|nr:hypothetical protein [Nitrospira japonica]SLM48085.1 conserved protein of unknown function [Nitrospira japonica]
MQEELKLLTSQRNEMFLMLQDNKFSPSEFEWIRWASVTGNFKTVPALRHIPTGYYFVVDRAENRDGEYGFFVQYSPGRETKLEGDEAGEWSVVTLNFARWLSYIMRETELPDLWEGLVKDTQLIRDTDQQSSDNLPFTNEELPRVRNAIEEIKRYIHKTHELSEAQWKMIDARFDYLEQKAGEFGRKDWMHIAVSVLLSIGVDHLQSSTSTRDLFQFASEVFKQALGAILYLAGPH